MIYLNDILQTYLRFIQGHALVHLITPVDVTRGRSKIFDLAPISAALLGVGWRVGITFHKVYPHSGAAAICPLVQFYLFIRRVVQHLVLSGKYQGLRFFLEDPLLIV